VIFRDRRDAGRQLAARLLRKYAGRDDVVVLALPRGGVPVAYEVALALGAPLDVFVVRKLGVPGNEEYAMGAIASGDVRVLNDEVIASLGIDPAQLAEVDARERAELARREETYRHGVPMEPVEGRVVILVDDGLATGASMRAAIAALRRLDPARIVAAVPIGAPETCEQMGDDADEVVCAVTPRAFGGVGLWYHDFTQTDDGQVRKLLAASRSGAALAGRRSYR